MSAPKKKKEAQIQSKTPETHKREDDRDDNKQTNK